MKRIVMLLLPAILCFSQSFAGEIFGTIKADAKGVSKGTKIDIVSAKKTYTTETDTYGSYRVYIPEKGKCTLKVHYNKQLPVLEIFSYDKSTRYDLNIESKDGQYLLKRK